MSQQNKERRFITQKFETREVVTESGEKEVYIKGYAATYDNPTLLFSGDGYEYWEVIRKGFFDGVLQDDVVCLFNHESEQILGRTTAQTLSIGTDDTGLWYECKLDTRNTNHLNISISLERGDVNKSSFAFNVSEKIETSEISESKTIYTCELIKCSRLWDVSPVVWPAYQDTESYVEARSEFEKRAVKEPQPNVECTALLEARSKLNILKSKF